MRAPAGSRAHLGLWAATPGSGPRRDQHVPCRLLELRCLCDTATRYISRTRFPWDEAQTRRYEPRHKRGAVPAAEQGWADPQAASSVLDASPASPVTGAGSSAGPRAVLPYAKRAPPGRAPGRWGHGGQEDEHTEEPALTQITAL